MIKKNEIGYSKFKYSFIEEDKEIGFIEVEETVDVINITDVFVKEEYRRKHVASKLFDAIFEEYKTKEKIMLEVRISNEPAINLYKKFGFKVIHTRNKYYKNEDAYIMEVKL